MGKFPGLSVVAHGVLIFFLNASQLQTFEIAECSQPLALHDLTDGVVIAKILNEM
jgi:hypothetical protein